MSHARPGGGLPGDESNYGLLHGNLDPFRRALFGVAADFADQMIARVSGSSLNILMLSRNESPDDRVPANAYTCRLSDAKLR